MSIEFRDKWLEAFYVDDKPSPRYIPKVLEKALYRKLEIIDAAVEESDLRIPPGNRFEHLSGNLIGWCSIRVNRRYRLIFRWDEGEALDTYLDQHKYRG